MMDPRVELILEELREVKKDVKELLADKHRIRGIVLVISVFVSGLVSILAALMGFHK